MTYELYYFSGTGNSLAIARDIAKQTGAKVLSIASAVEYDSINTRANALGIVFPVYHASVPLILQTFVEKLSDIGKKYIFGICTYGYEPGHALTDLHGMLLPKGGRLSAGFTVNMPYNYLTDPPEIDNLNGAFTLREIPEKKQTELLERSKHKVAEISASIIELRANPIKKNPETISKLDDEKRRLMDSAFSVDENCSGCGICMGVCPVGDIKMVDNRPQWQNRCEQCFACLHWCPQEAIQFGKNTRGKKRYHHPEVQVTDMIGF